MISEKQIRMIWVLAHQVGLDDEGLHEMVAGHTGKDSLRKLTNADISHVIEELTKAGARIRKKRKAVNDLPVNVVEIITPKQKKLIKYYEGKLEWQDNPNRLKGVSKRIIKKEVAATKKEGIKIILALRQIVKKASIKAPIEGCQ